MLRSERGLRAEDPARRGFLWVALRDRHVRPGPARPLRDILFVVAVSLLTLLQWGLYRLVVDFPLPQYEVHRIFL